MDIRDCSKEVLEDIREIYNEIIATSTALYEYEPRSADRMETWWDDKVKAGIPVIGAFEGSEFLGFGTWGPFRSAPAYSRTAEHSIYLKKAHRGNGLGKALLEAVVRRARIQGIHLLVGVIDAENERSCRLHEACGFVHAGTLNHAGFKFDRWLDVEFYQLNLGPVTTVADKVAPTREWSIREARPGDHEAVSPLVAMVHALHSRERPDVFRDLPVPMSRDTYLSNIANPSCIFRVAEFQGKVCAYLLAWIQDIHDHPVMVDQKVCHVDTLAVAPELRRHGIGRGLMEYCAAEAKERGIRKMALNVWHFNHEAGGFYESLGMHLRQHTWELEL